jgi:tetratricopeptide (TPR) repeat protein
MARALEQLGPEMYRVDMNQAHSYTAALQDLVAAARARLPELPREDAARAAALLLGTEGWAVGNAGFPDRRKRFMAEYAGTEAALSAHIGELGDDYRQEEIRAFSRHDGSTPSTDALDQVVRDHPRSVVAARALYEKAFLLSSPMFTVTQDPADRFSQIWDVVHELESGHYPACEWVDKAASLGTLSPGSFSNVGRKNFDRLLNATLAYVRSHFVSDDVSPADDGVGYVMTRRMDELFPLRRTGVDGADRAFAELEHGAASPAAVQYLKAEFDLERIESARPAERPALLRKARGELGALSAEGAGLYQRKALATLATLYLQEGRYALARDAYGTFLKSYPHSSFAWVAAIRIGLCDQALGDSAAALRAYQAAAATYASVPSAAVFAHAYEARALERLSRFDEALSEYRRTLEVWDDDYGDGSYSMYVVALIPNDWLSGETDRTRVDKSSLPPRILRLQRATETPGGALIERGRWLIEQSRYADALEPLSRAVSRYPASPAAPEARYLMHRARLQRTLAQVSSGSPQLNVPAAVAELTRLSSEPIDFAVSAASIARATILWEQG